MEVNKNKRDNLYSHFKTRWRNSINQFSRLQDESILVELDTKHKRDSSFRLRMINRLAQIDQQFHYIEYTKKAPINGVGNNKIGQQPSTKHNSNAITLQSWLTNKNVEESLIILNPELEARCNRLNQQNNCTKIRQIIVQELTEYNQSKYQEEMKQHCSKYNESVKSIFYSIINHPKKQLYQFCYVCDQTINTFKKDNATKKYNHKCVYPLDSLTKVQQALQKIKAYAQQKNNKIFSILLHNTMQPQVSVEQLISNVRVLKQSIQLNYEPQQAVLRMRLLNLIGKKIGFIIQQQDLQNKMNKLSLSVQKICS